MRVLESGNGYPEHDRGAFIAEISVQNSPG
jgi:hypothetical protein